jgi:hypothetical protein
MRVGSGLEPSLSYLTDEYKILQDKIDKIGAFRVTIKGWSVTATIAVFVAYASDKGFSPSITALAVDVLLGFFFWFEREQVILAWKFGGRARNIEVQIDKHRRAAGQRRGHKVLFASPNIARALFGTQKSVALISHNFKSSGLEKCRLWINREAKLALKSDAFFYIVLAVASWLPSWFGSRVQNQPQPIVIQNVMQAPPQSVSSLPATFSSPQRPKSAAKSRKSK